MKRFSKKTIELTTEELVRNCSKKHFSRFTKIAVCALVLFASSVAIFSVQSYKRLNLAVLNDEEVFTLASTPIAATSEKKDVISIPSGVVKANPFVPYRALGDEIKVETLVNDVPKFDLIAPPDFNENGADAAKIMDTVVSGILFDKYSPSAILNIDGTDYLVKKGDVVNNYKVINIAQNSVTVQFGKNTYKAGIGELLTEGAVKHNDVSNLHKKFGGEQR